MHGAADHPSTYYLSRHVFFCRAARNWIFLDVRNDRYFSIPSLEAESLAQVIDSKRTSRPSDPEARASGYGTHTGELVQELARRGVLCTDIRQARALEATVVAPAAFTICGDEESRHQAAATALAAVLAYATLASLQLRWLPLHRILQTVAERARRDPEHARQFDHAAAARLVATYNKARPLFPRKYLCIYDCLAMLGLFHAHRLYPTWVFGVTEDPFSAHCWLQHGSIVLNDNLDRVNTYTPIMTV
jgi:hypothetical protein